MAANSVAVSSIPCNQSDNFTSKRITLERTWTIENIKQMCSEQIGGQPVLFSPTFIAPLDKITTEDKKPVEFQLRFYPKGSGNYNKDFVAVFLELKNHPGLDIMYIHSVVKANGEKRYVVGAIDKFDLTNCKACKGHFRIMRRSELLDPAKGYVSNDSITLHCEVNIIVAESNKPDLVDQQQNNFAQSDQLAKSYGNLLESGSYADVTFVFDGGRKLGAHKLILVAQSREFANLFKDKMKEKASLVVIAKTRVEVFKQVLKFIYTGKVDGTSLDAIAKDLLICADKYKLDQLKSICEKHLAANITADSNLIDLHGLANLHNSLKLKAKVLDTINKKFQAQIQNANKFAQMDRFLSNLATEMD